jgi:hypothetical protein
MGLYSYFALLTLLFIPTVKTKSSSFMSNKLSQALNITQLLTRLQKVAEDVRLLAEASEEEDVMEMDISDIRNYYETLSKKACELF